MYAVDMTSGAGYAHEIHGERVRHSTDVKVSVSKIFEAARLVLLNGGFTSLRWPQVT
jgi:hypothetical protein